ncbi:SDR family NAD(P)-dependent oxidoreductase [Trujillonella humicola]|uniref:SDR family NAD(P)-dependent oxidoreductase n=1 Tax=Trujillonella humicola TaxID=3383699 RepID=UPI0039059575
MDDLAGRVAVVTGAASGLGRAMAERFAAEGMRVVLSDIDRPGLDAVAGQLAAAGAQVHAVPADVSAAGDVDHLAEESFARFGAVHLLCNNAGVVKSARPWALTVDDWRWVLGVDLWSVVHGIRAFVPRMLAQGGRAHVVNTASMTGLLPMPRLAAYSTAKAGVVALSESLQHDLDAEGADIGVSVFCPGFVATRITDSARNRPASLGDTAPATGPRTVSGVQPTLTAEEAAGQVLDAVRARRFWILTHPGYAPVVADRAARIGTGERPARPPVW